MAVPPVLLSVGGASGAPLAVRFLETFPGPVHLVCTAQGERVLARETGKTAADLTGLVERVFSDADLGAPCASGTVPYRAVVLLPASVSTLGKIASGIADTLTSRAAAVALKEGRRLVVCVRETPMSAIHFDQAAAVCRAGGIVMPVSPPWYFLPKTAADLAEAFVDHLCALLGEAPKLSWPGGRP